MPTTDGLPSRFPMIWPRAVIFDLDGTLADTVADIAVALNAALAEAGLSPHSEDQVRLMVGGGLGKLLQQALAAHRIALDDEAYQHLLGRLYALYADRPCEGSVLYDGALDVLGELRRLGIPRGLCTNKPEPIAHDVLAGLGIADGFGFALGGDAGFPKKPDPAGLLHVLKTLGSTPHETVMVGDSAADVGAARAGGLAGIVLVNHGYSALPASELGGNMVIKHLCELPQCLALMAERV